MEFLLNVTTQSPIDVLFWELHRSYFHTGHSFRCPGNVGRYYTHYMINIAQMTQRSGLHPLTLFKAIAYAIRKNSFYMQMQLCLPVDVNGGKNPIKYGRNKILGTSLKRVRISKKIYTLWKLLCFVTQFCTRAIDFFIKFYVSHWTDYP